MSVDVVSLLIGAGVATVTGAGGQVLAHRLQTGRDAVEHAEARDRDARARAGDRARDDREHLRALFEEGAEVLRTGYRTLTPAITPRPTLEGITAAIAAVRAVEDRLQLYLDDDDEVLVSFQLAAAGLAGVAVGGDDYPGRTPADAMDSVSEESREVHDARRTFRQGVAAYALACREALRKA